MITLTKLNGVPFVLNDDLIETIERTPDTTIHLTNGHLLIVRETLEEVVDEEVAFRKRLRAGLPGRVENGEGRS